MSSVRVEIVLDSGVAVAGTLTAESADALRDALGVGSVQRLGTIAEAATLLGISEPAARKHAQRGNLPVVRVGKRVLVDLNRLDA